MSDATILATDKLYDNVVSYELQLHTHSMVNPEHKFLYQFCCFRSNKRMPSVMS